MIKLNASPHIKKSQTFYILLAGNLVILTMIGLFVLRPVFGLLMKQTTEITQTRADTLTLQQKTDKLRTLKENYPLYEATYAPIVQNLPRTKDTAGYQTELEDLAKLTSNQLLLVDTSGKNTQAAQQGQAAPTTAGGFPTIPVKVDLTGTFASLLDFVNRLETMDRFTRVTSMDVKSSDGTGAVKATLELQTLYFPN